MSDPNNGDTTGGSLWPTASFGGAASGGGGVDKHTKSNKGMAARVTAADGDLATSVAIAATPAYDGFVEVLVNGVQVEVGDGVKSKPCYFSVDDGDTARALDDVAAGDKLYWNGTLAGYQLATTDVIDFDYEVEV